MTNERRYGDEEAREIFAIASRGDTTGVPAVAAHQGLTLAELQAVAREAGLEPARVAEAALTVDARHEALPRTRTLGLPTGVGRIVPLPEQPSEREWELIVAELGHTFGGLSKVSSAGNLRQWSNGEVHAFLEPTERGYRLRLTADQSALLSVGAAGGVVTGMAAMIFGVMAESGKLGKGFFVPIFLMLVGLLLLGRSVVRLPAWAREREQQMERVAARARALPGSDDRLAE